MSKFERKIISFEEGWDIVQKAVKNILEGLPDPHFTSDDFVMLYTTIYNMCIQEPPPHDYSQQLYEKYKETFEDYINSTVLLSLREKKDELLLRELLVRWSNHKIMTRLLSGIFSYIDGHHTSRRELPSLEEAGYLSFYSLVYDEMNRQVIDAILNMIDRKRAGEPIDETLVKNALTFYSEIGESTRKSEPKHFAETMIKEKAPFYYDEASNWIASSTFMDNTPKVISDEKMHDSTAVSSKKINLGLGLPPPSSTFLELSSLDTLFLFCSVFLIDHAL
ncbi:Cullin-1, variant 2 [Trifolium repens]|nr:Cullin-1, variant 2 [Trifolium repens]